MIDSLEQAFSLFSEHLKKNGVNIVNHYSDGIGEFIETNKNGIVVGYCMCFKREFYKNFQYHFPSLGKVGWGQIANKELMMECVKGGLIYVVVMPDEKIYWIEPKEWMEYYFTNKTDVPHLPGEIAVPAKMFKRFV